MGQEAATALKPAVAARLAPAVPNERVYADGRNPAALLPHAWIYAGNETPGRDLWETAELVYLHLWAKSLGDLKDLERKLRPLWEEVMAGSADGDARGFVYGRPSVTRTREADAWHATMIIPCTYTDVADLAMPP